MFVRRLTPLPRWILCCALLALAIGPAAAVAQPLSFTQRIVGASPGSLFGHPAVDGNWAVVGAPGEDGQRGAAYVYENVGGTWTQRQRLTASDRQAGDTFGWSVAVSGSTMAIGATQHDTPVNNAGAVYVFTRTGSSWTQQAKLGASDAFNGLGLGTDVAVEGDVVAAAGPGASSTIGAVYVYERAGGTWTETKLTGQGTPREEFRTVAISANTMCIGSRTKIIGSTPNTGAVYVYTRSGPGAWTLQQRLSETTPASGSVYGMECAVDGDTLVASASDAIGATSALGRVYAYTRTAGAWTRQQEILASATTTIGFGTTLALMGDTIVASGIGFNGSRGRVYVFTRAGGTWTETQTIDDGQLALNDTLGWFMGTDGTTLVVGAPNFQGPSPGSAYFFRLNGGAQGAPGAPSNVQATASGYTLTLTWSPPVSGGAPTSYTLLARTAPGAPPIASVPLGNTTSFSAVAPGGTFILSLVASNASGNGPESAPATVTLPGGAAAAPGPPTGLSATVSGSTVSFSWTAPLTGGAATGYTLHAGTTSGFTVPVASLPLPASTSLAIPGVPPGTYYVRLVAQNSGGASAPSNEVSFTVAAPAAPGTPTLNPAVVSGRTVALSWTPSGAAATSFTLRAFTGAGALLATAPGLTGSATAFGNVPSGTYLLELLAVNAAGVSAPSPRITVVVP